MFSNWLGNLKSTFRLSQMIAANPTCHLLNKCSLCEVKLDKFVTIFGNTVVYATNIGAYSYIQINGCIFNCDIGRFCSIGANVTIAPGMHDVNYVTTHPSFFTFNPTLPRVFVKDDKSLVSKRVIIGNDVWIGEKAVILDGVKIGNGAVIAAGAIVVKDVEPYSVVGGVPAHHIKYRFDEQTISFLQESKWWNFSDEWFENHARVMQNISEFINLIKCSSKDTHPISTENGIIG